MAPTTLNSLKLPYNVLSQIVRLVVSSNDELEETFQLRLVNRFFNREHFIAVYVLRVVRRIDFSYYRCLREDGMRLTLSRRLLGFLRRPPTRDEFFSKQHRPLTKDEEYYKLCEIIQQAASALDDLMQSRAIDASGDPAWCSHVIALQAMDDLDRAQVIVSLLCEAMAARLIERSYHPDHWSRALDTNGLLPRDLVYWGACLLDQVVLVQDALRAVEAVDQLESSTDDVKSFGLTLACAKGNETVMRYLLSIKVNVNRTNGTHNSWSSLEAVVESGNPELVKLLLQPEHQVERSVGNFYRPLTIAAEDFNFSRGLAMFKTIAMHFDSIEPWVPVRMLGLACQRDHRELARYLVQDLKINMVDHSYTMSDFRTRYSLEIAVRKKDPELVRIVLGAGRPQDRPDLVHDALYQALDRALSASVDAVECAFEIVPYIENELSVWSAFARREGGLELLEERLGQVDLNAPCYQDTTIGKAAIEEAYYYRRTTNVEWLLARGFDLPTNTQ